MRPSALLLTLALAGCNAHGVLLANDETPPRASPYTVTFKRHASIAPPVTMREARIVYAGDLGALEAAGAVLIGFQVVTSTAAADETEEARAAARASAGLGATHVALIREDALSETRDAKPTSEQKFAAALQGMGRAMSCDDRSTRPECTSQPKQRTETVTTRTARYAVIAVPRDAWPKLPAALRPF